MAPNSVIGTVADAHFPFAFPNGLALTPDGQYLYVTNLGNNSVSVVNVSSNIVTATVRDTTYPFGNPYKADTYHIVSVDQYGNISSAVSTTSSYC